MIKSMRNISQKITFLQKQIEDSKDPIEKQRIVNEIMELNAFCNSFTSLMEDTNKVLKILGE